MDFDCRAFEVDFVRLGFWVRVRWRRRAARGEVAHLDLLGAGFVV